MKKLLTNARPSSMYAAVIIALALTPIIYWSLDDTPPRVITSIQAETSPEPGGVLRLRFFGYSLRRCPARVNETITDAHKIVYPIQARDAKIDISAGPIGNGLGVPIDVDTPAGAVCGPAQYDSEVEFTCNPVQRVWPLTVHRHVTFQFCGNAVNSSRPDQP